MLHETCSSGSSSEPYGDLYPHDSTTGVFEVGREVRGLPLVPCLTTWYSTFKDKLKCLSSVVHFRTYSNCKRRSFFFFFLGGGGGWG